MRRGSTAETLALAALLLVPACGNDAQRRKLRAPPEAVPEAVSIAGANMTVGTKLGTIRESSKVEGFRISRFPTTVAQYSLCVRATACGAPAWKTSACAADSHSIDGRTYDKEQTYPDAPVTCVSPQQAKAYCDWVGGQLATIEQWLLGARGTNPARFSWGSAAPTCARYGRRSIDSDDPEQLAAARCNGPEVPAVGQRPGGKSPLGLEDILITQGELVGGSAGAAMPACQGALGCMVTGFSLGGIDLVVPLLPAAKEDEPLPEIPSSGFRCAWRSST